MSHFRTAAFLLAAGALLAGGQAFHAQAGIAYTQPQIEQMVAPVALYPDALVSQVLMAATFPGQVADADQWMRANPGIEGRDLDEALSTATWDPSVISLCKFPSLLDRMGRNIQWTTDLGYAFEGQRDQVMGAIQRLRRESYDSGYLRSTPQQTVVVEPSYIVIQPYSPGVVYVPAYNPAVVYGPAWAYPAPLYASVWAPSPGVSFVNGFAWGVGFAVGQALFGGCDWHHHDVYVNNTVMVHNTIYRNTTYYRNREWEGESRRVWVHHPEEARYEGHRGAPYGGESHGAVHGTSHMPPAYVGHGGEERRGEPAQRYTPEGRGERGGDHPSKGADAWQEKHGAHGPVGAPEGGHPGAAHPPEGKPYTREYPRTNPQEAAPREAHPGQEHPPAANERSRPGEGARGPEREVQPARPPEAKEKGKEKEKQREQEKKHQ